MGRREDRAEAFELAFSNEFQKGEIADVIAVYQVEEAKELSVFSQEILEGVFTNLSEIDGHISGALQNWNMKRIPKTTLTALRIGVYEILFCEKTPNAVAVNEAVELAKNYGLQDDGNFANGILTKIAREAEGGNNAK